MQGVTEMVDESLVGKELPESLHPIQAWQDRLTVVNGHPDGLTGGGHSNDFGALGVYNCGSGVGNSGMAAGETIDVARQETRRHFSTLASASPTERNTTPSTTARPGERDSPPPPSASP